MTIQGPAQGATFPPVPVVAGAQLGASRMAAQARAVERSDRLAQAVLGIWIVLIIVLQRFALPVGVNTIFLSLFFGPVMIGLLLLSGRLVFHPSSFAMTLLFIAILLPSQALLATRFAPTSLALFLVLAIPYVFRIDPQLDLYPFAIRRFRTVMGVCAVLGIYQFLGQFVLPPELVFPIDNLIPREVLKRGYLHLNPLTYGVQIYKANGIFFLEPSFFSQALALAIIIELLYFNSVLRLGIYAVALVLTFSGTGLMVLAATLPLVILRRSVSVALSIAGAGVAILIAASFAAPEFIDAYTSRFTELARPGTSGYARFTLPLLFAWDMVVSGRVLVGLGAGGIEDFRMIAATQGSLFDPTWFKLLVEYGLPTFLLFAGILVFRLLVASRSGILGLGMLVLFFVTGGYLVDSNQHALLLTLLVLHGGSAAANARRPVDLPR